MVERTVRLLQIGPTTVRSFGDQAFPADFAAITVIPSFSCILSE